MVPVLFTFYIQSVLKLRTAPLTSKRWILYVYSTNIGTEYFKHGIYSPFFFSSKCSLFHNSNVFVPVLFTFYIQSVLKLRTAPLTSKRCILYIYSTNIGTEYFEHGIYSPFFSLQNAVCFITVTYFVPVLFTFYIQSVIILSTAPLTSKRCILYIYSTNIGTEYLKHGIYSPFFLFKMQFVS